MVGIILSTTSFLPSTVKAATISGISIGAETSVAASTTVNSITYQGYSRPITSFNVGTDTWDPDTSSRPTVTLRRSNSAPATATNNKQVVWERYITSPSTVRGTLPTTTAAALVQNNIYLGTDNLFANTGNNSGNQSDVERVDFVFPSGYRASRLERKLG